MLRSLAYTCLLEWDEFRALEVAPRPLGTLVVTDLVEKITRAQQAGDTSSVFEMYREYRRDITPPDNAPGALERYALALLAQKQRRDG